MSLLIAATLIACTQPTLEINAESDRRASLQTESASLECRAVPARPNPFHRALAFDGIDDHATIPAAPSLTYPGQGGWTVELWVKPTDYPTAETAILAQESINVPGHDPYSIRAYPTHFAFRVDGPQGGSDEIAFDLPLGVWSHVAATYHADDHDHRMAVFVNGDLLEQRPTAVHMESRVDPIRLGNVGREYGQPYFTGLLDDARIWKRALTSPELAEVMVGQFRPLELDLVLDLTFNSNLHPSPIMLDASPAQNHALLGDPLAMPNHTAPARVLRSNPLTP